VRRFGRKVHVRLVKMGYSQRTRSYPFERVYNTLEHSKKITVIPVVKDEGMTGDRDYIQWDTVALTDVLFSENRYNGNHA